MVKAINQVFQFVNEQTGYRASLGVITSTSAGKTILAWGALNIDTGDTWVPELADVRISWPDAQWTPMSQQQASLFEEAYQNEKSIRHEWLHSL